MIRTIIVEDEKPIAEHLELMLQRSGKQIEVLAKTGSVSDTLLWLKQYTADLIFMDIQLHNDLCFEIFDNLEVTTPVIFTTSYNQYAIQSFEVNSLAYLLKPIEEEFLYAALDKYQLLYHTATVTNAKVAAMQAGFQERFLVQSGKAIKSIPVQEVAYIKVNKNFVVLTTKNAKQYVLGSTLDAIEQRLDTKQFFRINRQIIISIDAIDNMYPHTRGRFKIETQPPCREEIVVALERAADFKNWLIR